MVRPEDVPVGQRMILLIRPDAGDRKWTVTHVTIHKKTEDNRLMFYPDRNPGTKLKEISPEDLFFTDEAAMKEYRIRNAKMEPPAKSSVRKMKEKQAAKEKQKEEG